MRILIKNGRIVGSEQKKVIQGDILVEDGIITEISAGIKTKADKVIDAKDKIVAPGFIDMHTHLREPGREDAETVETALEAAIAGGFTTVSAMPNTQPACDSQAHVKFLLDRAKEVGLANILPIGAITKKRQGAEMAELGELKESGCLAVSDDGSSVEDTFLMRKAMEYAQMVDLLVVSHCEDKKLSDEGVMHEGYWSTVLGLKPIPREAESVIVERDINLAALTGARLHIAHVSASPSVDIIRQAKKNGIKVTAEVTPHHLVLTDADLKTYDTNMKVNPPLRSASDVKALKEALKDGTIDVIATDHAPHPENEKEKEFDYAPFGMIGLETALSLSAGALIDEGYLDWPGLVEKLSANPAKILKYARGILKKGAIADIVIIDPNAKWVYAKDKIKSKSSNSPFIARQMKAQVTDVMVSGRIVLENGDKCAKCNV